MLGCGEKREEVLETMEDLRFFEFISDLSNPKNESKNEIGGTKWMWSPLGNI